MTNIASVELSADVLAQLAWTQFWQVSVVALLVAALVRWGCRRRPHLAYLLWMLVVVKALTPPLVASQAGIFSWTQRSAPPQLVAVEPVPAAPRVSALPVMPRFDPLPAVVQDRAAFPPRVSPALPLVAQEPVSRFAWVTPTIVIATTWLLGVMGLSIFVMSKWVGYRRRWRAASVVVPASLERRVSDVAARLHLPPRIRRRLKIMITRETVSPAVFGIWRATLLLPADLFVPEESPEASNISAKKTLFLPGRGQGEGLQDTGLSNQHADADGNEAVARDTRLNAILAHELIHLRRGDTAAAFVQLVAQLFWWFHPLVWWANREARRERERACDEEVVTGLGCRPADYARALLDVLERQSQAQPAFAVPGVGMLGVTARRLDHLLQHADRFQKWTPWSYYATALVALVLLLPGAGLPTRAAPPAEVKTENLARSADAPLEPDSLPARGQGEGSATKESDTVAPAADRADKPAIAKPTIIVTEHVILWDRRIITWEQMVLRFRTLRADGPISPHFKFTNGAINNRIDQALQQRIQKEIYVPFCDPEPMSVGAMSPRASERLDRIRTADDLRQDPAREHKGQVLTAEGKPAVGAQVVVLPPDNPSGVVLAGTQLRDPYDHEWTPADSDGRYTVYPENDEYVLAIFHPTGCDIRPGPTKDESPTINLAPWATVTFTSTGGIKEQSGDVRCRATALGPNSIDFIVYQTKVDKEPVTVLIPPGDVRIGRSLEMDEGSSVTLPVEQIDLAAGEDHEVALGPPTAADRAKADDVHRPMREARAASKQRREQKQAAAQEKDEEQKPASPRNDVPAGEGQPQDKTSVDTDATKAADGAAQPAPRQYKATGVFVPKGAVLTFTPDALARPARDPNEPAAAERLRKLGAFVEPAFYDGDPPGRAWDVSIRQGWKGTDADLKLINELPDVAFLYFDLTASGGTGIGGIKLAASAENLTISPVTNEVMAKITGLPAARNVTFAGCSLSAAGCQRAAELARGVERLTLQGVFDPQDSKKPPVGVDDAGLAKFGQLESLRYLELVHLAITDGGLAGLAGLKNLDEIRLVMCPGLRGAGYGALAPLTSLRHFSAYMMPLTREVMTGLAQLVMLEDIHFQLDKRSADELQPEDFGALAKLSHLRTLTFTDPENAPDALRHLDLGNALLRAAAEMPELRDLQLDGLGVDATGLAALAPKAEIESLFLRPVVLDEDGLSALGQLKKLKRLGVTAAGKIVPGNLAKLASLSQLKFLSIDHGGFADDALKSFAPLKALERLNLSDSQITGAGLPALAPLVLLKELTLERSPLNDAGCENLPAFQSLEVLNLSETKITDRALASIVRLTRLRSLTLNGTAITPAGLATLRDAKSLRSLQVEGLKATADEMATLRKELPAVHLDVIGRGFIFSAEPPKKSDGANNEADDEPLAPNEFRAFGEGKAEPAPKAARTGTFSSAGKQQGEGGTVDEAAAQQAIAQLRAVGLDINGSGEATPTTPLTIGLNRGWKGKPDDLRLLLQLPNVKYLHVRLEDSVSDLLNQIALAKPLDVLILEGATDERMAKITQLPKCRALMVTGCDLSADGCRRVAELAPDVTDLQIDGPFASPGDKPSPKGVTDDGLRFIGQMHDLKSLVLMLSNVTDAGIAHLASLEKLKTFTVGECPGVHGAGLRKLKGLTKLRELTVRVSLDSAGLKGMSELTQLQSLQMLVNDAAPADLAPLVALVNLNSLSLWREVKQADDAAVGNAALKAAGAMPALQSLVVYGFGPTSEGLTSLATAARLQKLSLIPAELSDQGIAALGRLSELRQLNVTARGEVTAAGLAQLAPLTKLTELEIDQAGVTDAGLRELARLKTLESITFVGSKITGAGLSGLTPLTALKSLALVDAPLDDAGLATLVNLPALVSLNLGKTIISDAGLATLAKMAQLKALDLSETAVTPTGLASLRTLKNLRTLRVIGLKADRDAMSTLRKALPGVKIAKSGRTELFVASKLEVMEVEPQSEAAAGPLEEMRLDAIELSVAMQEIRKRPQDVTPKQFEVLAGRLEQALAADPDSLSLLGLMAELRDRQGRADDALAIYRRLLKRPGLDPNWRALCSNNVAYALAIRGKQADLAEAERLIGDAVDVFGPTPDLLDTRAVVMLTKGDVEHARADIKKSIDAQPTAAKYFHLALIEEKGGDAAAMTEAFKEALGMKLDEHAITSAERPELERLKAKIGAKAAVSPQGKAEPMPPAAATGTFTAAGKNPRKVAAENGSAASQAAPAASGDDAAAAQARLRALGANIYELNPNRADGMSLYLGREWKGADADLELINALPDVRFVTIELGPIAPAAIGRIEPAKRIKSLILSPVTDEMIEKIARLPSANAIVLSECSLSATGCQRLAKLAAGATELQIQGVRGGQPNSNIVAVPDAGLAALCEIESLRSLQLINTAVTDMGLMPLAKLEKLASFMLANCPGVKGRGLTSLRPLAALRALQIVETPLDAEGLKSLAELTQLRALTLHLKDSKPDALSQLKSLINLRALTVMGDVPAENTAPSTDNGDAILRAATAMTELVGLSLQGVATSDTGLSDFAPAAKLRVLSLQMARVTDATLQSISRFTKLSKLWLGGEGDYTAVGLKQLAALTQLKQLEMSGGPVTDDMLSHLANLATLESLTLTHGKFTGSGLTSLAPLIELKKLNLADSLVDDPGSRALPSLAGLESLDLDSTKITDRALDSIGKLENVSLLSLSYTAITGEGLTKLAGLRKLESITLRGNNISKLDRAKFAATHPNVNIEDTGAWLSVRNNATRDLQELDGEGIYSLEIEPEPQQ
ncbi:MAG TPA: M56 family metallopeptidase [Pirellulales bacterium]